MLVARMTVSMIDTGNASCIGCPPAAAVAFWGIRRAETAGR